MIEVKINCHITIKKRKRQSFSSVTHEDASYDNSEYYVYNNINRSVETYINMNTNV